jgi:phosphoribosyl-dephospho-CoA transferase
MNSCGRPGEAPFIRHSFVRVWRDAWDAFVASQPGLADELLVRDWAARGWPLIVRRPGPCDANRIGVSLGLPLPPIAGKRRISVVVPADAIRSVEPPPELATLRDIAPSTWRATIDSLAAIARRHHVRCRAFGSLAWQGLTGLPYLHERSDLDLLFELPQGTDVMQTLDALLNDLAACDATAPMRIDGEIIRTDGAGANWRELHASEGDVVVKTGTDVVLASVHEFAEG